MLKADQLEEVWRAMHSAPGCGPATAAEASRARQKAANAVKEAERAERA